MKKAALIALMLLLPATAQAQVAVLGFEAEPGSEKMANWVTKALRHWAKAKGMKLGPEKDAVEVKLVYGCSRGRPKCMGQIAKAMKVRRLVFGKVRRQGRHYVVVIKHLDMRRPKNLDTVSKRMPIVGASYSAVRGAAAGWFSKLIGTTVTGTLRIRCKPSGGLLVVDGKEVGPIPASGVVKLNLPPGKHTVLIRKEGFQRVERTVNIRLGRTARVRIKLEKGSAGPPVTPTRPRPRVDPRPVVGTGGTGEEPVGPIKKKEKGLSQRTWWQIAFYSSAAVAVGLLAGAVYTGWKTESLEKEAEDGADSYVNDNDDGVTVISKDDICNKTYSKPGGYDGKCNKGKTFQNTNIALFVTAGVVGAAAAVFSYFAFFKNYDKEEPVPESDKDISHTKGRNPVRVTVNPEVWKQGGGLNVRLDF